MERYKHKKGSKKVMNRADGPSFCSDYINIRTPVYLSHSAGKYAVKRFRKAQCPIIERLTNALMMNGRNNGKKLMAVRIVAHAFEIVRLPISATQKTLNTTTSERNPNKSHL